MKNLLRIKDLNCPNSVEMLGDGTYNYNYDILAIKETVPDIYNPDATKEETMYSYVRVTLRGIPTYSDIVKALIRKYVSLSEEFDIINSYNKSVLFDNIDEKATSDYKEYLLLLDTIKNKVKLDKNVKN